jgi:putative FmdB family regulatory protein
VCASCGNRLEAVQGFSDPPLTTCERCGGALRRVFHPAGILFKGSGFYSTDNRRPAGSAKSKPGDKTGEGKPAEKSPASASSTKTAETSAT